MYSSIIIVIFIIITIVDDYYRFKCSNRAKQSILKCLTQGLYPYTKWSFIEQSACKKSRKKKTYFKTL